MSSSTDSPEATWLRSCSTQGLHGTHINLHMGKVAKREIENTSLLFLDIKLYNPVTDVFIQYLFTTHTYKGGIQAHKDNEISQSSNEFSH